MLLSVCLSVCAISKISTLNHTTHSEQQQKQQQQPLQQLQQQQHQHQQQHYNTTTLQPPYAHRITSLCSSYNILMLRPFSSLVE